MKKSVHSFFYVNEVPITDLVIGILFKRGGNMLKNARRPISYNEQKCQPIHNMTVTVYNLPTKDSIDIAECISNRKRKSNSNIISIFGDD